MKTTGPIFLTGVIVLFGRWSNKKELDGKAVVAVLFLALFMAILSEADEDIAFKLSVLVLLTVSFVYLPKIFGTLGLDGYRKGNTQPKGIFG